MRELPLNAMYLDHTSRINLSKGNPWLKYFGRRRIRDPIIYLFDFKSF